MSLKGNILGTLVLRPDMIFFSFLWVCLFVRNQSAFCSSYNELFFVLTVETSLIDKDGKVFMSLKGNILGTLVLRPDMMFFSFFVGAFVFRNQRTFCSSYNELWFVLTVFCP